MIINTLFVKVITGFQINFLKITNIVFKFLIKNSQKKKLNISSLSLIDRIIEENLSTSFLNYLITLNFKYLNL